MKNISKALVTVIAVTSVFASFASADVRLPPYQDDESGYQIYQNLGGELTAALADTEVNHSDIQESVDRRMVWLFGSSEYQISNSVARKADVLAMERFDILAERICFD